MNVFSKGIIALSALITINTPAASAQKLEFEAASVRANPPQAGLHFNATDTGSGGPGTANPGLFRCNSCTLATLVSKAFGLRAYQLPGRAALGDGTYEVNARIKEGATPAEFRSMLQQLLVERFGLEYHFSEKRMGGYHLVVAKNGPKMPESIAGGDAKPAAGAQQHGAQGGGHAHTGVVNWGGNASFRANQQTTADLATVLGDQLNVPVDDQTGLGNKKFDIALSWSASLNQPSSGGGGDHGPGGGGWGHGDRGPGGGGGDSHGANSSSGQTLFDALQTQLGLKLAPSEQAVAQILVIDRVRKVPSGN